MTEYRIARPSEYEAYLSFANMVFRKTGNDIYFDEAIPKVYGPEADASAMQRIAVNERGIVGLVAVMPNTLHTMCGDLTTGYVGTVSVHPEARGEGHMKRLMHDWIAAKKAEGCDLLMLGGQRQRYGYFGFAQAGRNWELRLSAACVRHALADADASGIRFEVIRPDSEAERLAKQLHQRQAAWYDRSAAGFAVTCRTFRHRAVAAFDRDGSLLGYFVRSEKSAGELCEIASRDNLSLDRMLKTWMAVYSLGSLTVQLPDWDRRQLLHLRAFCEHTGCCPGMMALVLNWTHTIEVLMNLKARWTRLQDGDLCLCVDGETFTIHVRDNRCTVEAGGADPLMLTACEAIALLLDPFPLTELPAAQLNWFPLPLYCAAPDEF